MAEEVNSLSYTLRYSPRARHVRLKITPGLGLEIIAPKRFNEKEIPSILEKHQAWITRTLSKMPLITQRNELPNELNLAAISQVWVILYIETEKKSIKINEENNQLLLLGNVHDKDLVKKALRKWLSHHAKSFFKDWLDKVSKEANLPYKKLSIRYTTSRWGSCSTRKTISLSTRLLFLKPELVEHIMIHELCHTVHFNHSKQFWALFEILQGNYKDLKKEVRALSKELYFL